MAYKYLKEISLEKHLPPTESQYDRTGEERLCVGFTFVEIVETQINIKDKSQYVDIDELKLAHDTAGLIGAISSLFIDQGFYFPQLVELYQDHLITGTDYIVDQSLPCENRDFIQFAFKQLQLNHPVYIGLRGGYKLSTVGSETIPSWNYGNSKNGHAVMIYAVKKDKNKKSKNYGQWYFECRNWAPYFNPLRIYVEEMEKIQESSTGKMATFTIKKKEGGSMIDQYFIDSQINKYPFTDLESLTEEMRNSIISQYKKGNIKGYKDKTYKPNQPLTRGEFAILLDRLGL